MQGTGFSRYVSTIGIGAVVLGGIVAYLLLGNKDSSYPTESLVTERDTGLVRHESHQVQDRTDLEQQGWVETTYDQTRTNSSPLPERAVIDVDNWIGKAGSHLARPLNSRGFSPTIAQHTTGQKSPNRSMPAPHFWAPYLMDPADSSRQRYRALPGYPHYALAPHETRYNRNIRPRKPRRNMCFFMGFN